MTKNLLFIVLVGAFQSISAQVLERGDLLLDVNFGALSWRSAMMSQMDTRFFSNIKAENAKKIFLEPQLRVEYALSPTVVIGAEVRYSYLSYAYTASADSFWVDGYPSNHWEYVTGGRGKITKPLYSLAPKISFHTNSYAKLDLYSSFSAGVKLEQTVIKGVAPVFYEITDDWTYLHRGFDIGKGKAFFQNRLSPQIIRFYGRAAIGGRYMFTENLGVNAELGLGGSLLSIGLSLKNLSQKADSAKK